MSALSRKYESLAGQLSLGTPSPERPASDGRGLHINCDPGEIYWSKDSGAHLVMNAIKDRWNALGGVGGPLGYPLTDELDFAWGPARVNFFQGGAIIWTPQTGAESFLIELPQLGNPAFVSLAEEVPISVRGGSIALAALSLRLGPGLTTLWTDRLYLRPVATTSGLIPLQPLEERHEAGERLSATFTRSGAVLTDRTLYDICFKSTDDEIHVVAPHAVYAKDSWTHSGLAHITDLHVSRRLDGFAAQLQHLGFADGAAKVNNCNDNLRHFVRTANCLHRQGALDVIIATGDLVDYVSDEGDLGTVPDRAGNFGLLEDICRGQSPSPSADSVEELCVPILTTLGNHDYRSGPYPLIGDAAIGGLAVDVVRSYSGFNLTEREAVAMVGGRWGSANGTPMIPLLPDISKSTVTKALQVSDAVRNGRSYYHRRLCRERSFVARLGPHRVVMLDTGPDVGATADPWELFKAVVLGIVPSEDRSTFVGGSPNSEGIQIEDTALLRSVLAEAPQEGVVIIGMHSPPVNIAGDEYGYFFRESEHPTAESLETVGFLHRQHAVRIDNLLWNRDPGGHPDWPRTGTPYFKTGSTDNLLDAGVARGNVAELLQLCAGAAGRAVDLILFGHVHRHVEFRIAGAQGELQYFLDFYTSNPKEYYATKAVDNRDPRQQRAVRVFVDAPVDPTKGTHRIRDDAAGHFESEWRRAVPSNSTALNDCADPKEWWREHRPLLLQSAPLGPIDSNQRPDRSVTPDSAGRFDVSERMPRPGSSFRGFRLLTVSDGVVTSVDVWGPTERIIEDSYWRTFGRAPGPSELRAWVAEERAFGHTTDSLIERHLEFLISPSGASERLTMLHRSFASIFGREPGTWEVSEWLPVITSERLTFDAVVTRHHRFLASPSGDSELDAVIDRSYAVVFQRAASAEERNGWKDEARRRLLGFGELVAAHRQYIAQPN